jgi:CubicO group peptidase (beta-lactamase class C family)
MVFDTIKITIRKIALVIPIFAGQGVSAQDNLADITLLESELFQNIPVTSFIVHQSGQRIMEQYRGSMHGDRTINIKSASKSIISLLVGIAIENDHITDVKQPIKDYFPEYFKKQPDKDKEAITIEDLLTMRAGLESTSRRNYGRWVLSHNWVDFALSRPFIEDPGGTMVYSTGSSHLLSVIITRATGMSTLTFANKHLFGPMDIRVGGWDKDPQGYYMGGNNLALSPNSMIKIGQLVMDKGRHKDKQLVPEAWIAESMKTYTRSNFNPYNFGYHWWHRELGEKQLLFAWGNGGQFIFILPDLETVIAVTSTSESTLNNRTSRIHLFSYLENQLIPYLQTNLLKDSF